MKNKQKDTKTKIKDKVILGDVYLIYLICIIIGFIGTLIYFIYTKKFGYINGWLLPVPFVLCGLFIQQLIPDYLLKKARDYGEYAKKPRGFMALSSLLYLSSYFLYVLPFIIMWAIEITKNTSLTSENGWFNIYCAIGSTFLLLLLVFVVKLFKNYYSNKRNSKP